MTTATRKSFDILRKAIYTTGKFSFYNSNSGCFFNYNLMAMARLALFYIILLTLISCGGEVEKQRLAELQKAREDSIREAVELETRTRLERRNALQDSIRNGESMLSGFRNRLISVTGEVAAAKDKLNTIKGFQFLRTDAEREQQIKNQTVIILSLENDLSSMQEKIMNMQRKIEDYKRQLTQVE